MYNNLWKFHRNQMNVLQYALGRAAPGTPASKIFIYFFLISKTIASMFSTCESSIAIGWKVCAPGMRTPSTPASTVFYLFIFFYFQNHHEHVWNNLSKFHRNRMNAVCSCRATPGTRASTIFFISKTTASMFTTFESYITIGWTVCAPVRQHRVLQLVQFLNSQNHREHVSNNLWKFHRNRMNGVCSCKERATPGTPASTIFKFFKIPKPPRACFQLVKVSSQSDERCELLYGTDTQTDIHFYI